jgi:hypothetical protein
MARLFLAALTLLLFFTSHGQASVRDYSKFEDAWRSESSKAYVSGKTIFDDDTIIINLFVISFEKKYECRPVFKVAFLEGNEYGELLETIPMDSGFLKIFVDNKIRYDGPVVRIEYSNVTEFGASVSPEMLSSIYDGELVQIELVDKMDIIFNLKNSKSHIDKAQKSCLEE